LAEGGFLPWSVGIFEQRHHAVTFEVIGKLQIACFAECGIDIDVFCQGLRAPAGRLHSRHTQDHRHVGVELEICVLTPAAVLAKFPAVIAPEDNDGVVGELQLVKLVEQASDQGVDVGNAGVVAVNQLPGQFVGAWSFLRDAVIVAQLAPICHGVFWSVLRDEGIIREFDVPGFVHIPVVLRSVKGQMRLIEAHCEKERSVFKPVQLFYCMHDIGPVGVGIIGHLRGLERRASALHLRELPVVQCHFGDGGRSEIAPSCPDALFQFFCSIRFFTPSLPVVIRKMVNLAD